MRVRDSLPEPAQSALLGYTSKEGTHVELGKEKCWATSTLAITRRNRCAGPLLLSAAIPSTAPLELGWEHYRLYSVSCKTKKARHASASLSYRESALLCYQLNTVSSS